MSTAVTRHGYAWFFCVLILPLYPAPADAEEARSGRRIEEVIVTAERREASIQDTSISITAFTAEFLDDFGIRNQEDLQNFVPATTIQPYDATVRGVGRNFRALGGDPGVSTYMNGIYSEDLLTATAATFWDVERIEVLRGPQGTLYGRNAVGGAINILYKEPTEVFESSVKGIVGNFGTQEAYAAVSGPIIRDRLAGRINYAYRDRDGTIDEIGDGPDLDSLGTDAGAVQLKWTPTDTMEFKGRHNWMKTDRVFGGADGAGLVVLNENGEPFRNTTDLVPGHRRIDATNTDPANVLQQSFYDVNSPIVVYNDPDTGEAVQTQANRAGIDEGDFDGFPNYAASLDGFGVTTPETAARYNDCVFPGKIKGNDVCAASNGQNWEEFEQEGTQFSASWDVTDSLQLKYLWGLSDLSYERITDDDRTASKVFDRQFYVNHEATYQSHELQAFYDFGERLSFTSGIFFYEAQINQRGDFYTSLGTGRMTQPYPTTSLSGFIPTEMVTLFSARKSCDTATPAPTCERNYAVENRAEDLGTGFVLGAPRNDNLQVSNWGGDDGTNRALDVNHGPRTIGTDLLYSTKTERDAFAAYTQGAWNISEAFTLTFGIRYAEDEVTAEENLFRYTESTLGLVAPGVTVLDAVAGGNANFNIANGGIVPDGNGGYRPVQDLYTNGGLPIAVSVYRPFKRKDDQITWRLNLDWDINDNAMMYFSTTTGYRSGGYNLVFFSNTPTYEPEELIAYEIGYKTQWLDNTLQVNGSIYYYDYEQIHTTASEVTSLGGITTSVLAAPGADIYGIEGEVTWLATDRVAVGGNFSWTPSEYSEDFFIKDPSSFDRPTSVFEGQDELTSNVKGNRVLQVPEGKATAWGSYTLPVGDGSLELFGVYSWISEVYYSSFETEAEKADAYDRVDLRGTYTSGGGKWIVSGFVNNVFDDVGVLQVLADGEQEFFAHSAATTVPRLYGLEVTFNLGNY
jgi:outer membrane receptor protein involved in Fe transport